MPRGGSNYIPRPDSAFGAWQANYIQAVETWVNDQGLSLPLLDEALAAKAAWDAAYPAHIAAQAAARAACAAKDQARAEYERAIRPLTNFLQSDPALTDALRASFGITVRDATRTPAPAPTTRPLVIIEPAARLTHRLRLVDEATPTRRGKPEGTLGAEVWVRLVEPGNGPSMPGAPAGAPASPPPGDPAAFRFLALTSRGAMRAAYPLEAGGKTAVYMLRWVNTRGQKGPWSEAAAATVAA